jgi:hypothetical protein
MATTPEQEKQKLIDSALTLRKKGKTNTEISKILNVPRTTLFGWIGGSTKKIIIEKTITTDENDLFDVNSLQGLYNNISNKEEDILRFIENIRPISYPAPVRSGTKKVANKIAVVIGDLHFGMEHQPTIDIFFQVVSDLRPEKVILNGDTLDMFAISKYPKDARHNQSLADEQQRYHKFLKILHDITIDWNCEILETNANHSGNSQEGRYWRYISNGIGTLAALPRVQELLSYQNVFFPPEKWCRVKLVDNVILPTNLIVQHGTVVRKHGGMSARGEFEKILASTLTNHTHRFGCSSQRFPAAGHREEQTFVNYENACACRFDVDYVQNANWQNGFAIVNYTGDSIGVEQVVVYGNKATVCSLNKTIKV